MNDVMVGTGEIKIANEPQVLSAIGLGSCVAVCLYDPQKKQGGLAHVALPHTHTMDVNSAEDSLDKYADIAIPKLVSLLEKNGSLKVDLQAKLVGGSEMFSKLGFSSESIGSQNIRSVREELQKANIHITSEDLGGSVGRSLRFFQSSGDVEVIKRM